MPPHSVVLSFIGACLLWVGWFGFNAGSALAAGSLATSAFVATHFACRRGGCGLGGGGMDPQRQAQRAWREFPVRSLDWWRSRPRRVSWGPCLPC